MTTEQETLQLISSLMSNVVKFFKSVNVPGFQITFFELFIGVFLFCCICKFIYQMLAFGGNGTL